MARKDLEPLDLVTWLEACARFRQKFERQQCTQNSTDIRRLFHLLQLAPTPISSLISPQVSENLFEQILDESKDIASVALLNTSLCIRFESCGETGIKLTLSLLESSELVTAEHHKLPTVVMDGLSNLMLSLARAH